MSKPIYLSSSKNKKSHKIYKMLACIGVFVILSFGILCWMQKEEAPILQHRWQSDETGVVLAFTSDGKVTFQDNLPSGTYHIVSPNRMEYTIEGQTFLMTYHIQDKKLYWGLGEETLECFSRY